MPCNTHFHQHGYKKNRLTVLAGELSGGFCLVCFSFFLEQQTDKDPKQKNINKKTKKNDEIYIVGSRVGLVRSVFCVNLIHSLDLFLC